MIPIEENGVTQYTGTGSRTYFEYGFAWIPGSDVKVLVDDVVPVYTTQPNGVVITPAPILGAVVILFRLTDVDQLSDWVVFESFDAAKTEDACDKLIMLKSEAWYRVQMNLTSEHLLDRVILHNDNGTDAHLLIWNELHPGADPIIPQAGVFAGEVTEDMPEPGTFVEKPDDFAYFQWGMAVTFNAQVVTSTLYPLETDSGATFSGAIVASDMRTWIEGFVGASIEHLGATLEEVVIDDGETEDMLEAAIQHLGATLVEVVIDDGTTTDPLGASIEHLGASLTPLLVTADTQDTGIAFSGAIVAASMDDAP